MKSSETNRPFTPSKHNNKLGTNIENNMSDKDKAVENVIRRLRQKKNIEVSPMPGKTTKPFIETFEQSKTPMVNQDSFRITKSNSGVYEVHSGHENNHVNPTDYMEIEDDEIEDYLEIDENVVEDLQALIPEEEIVSMSNSLIKPEEPNEDSTSDSEVKPDNTEILVKPSTEPILIYDERESQSSIQENNFEKTNLKTEQSVESENNVETQHKDLVTVTSPESSIVLTIKSPSVTTEQNFQPSEVAVGQGCETSHEVVIINNNDSDTEKYKILPATTNDVESKKRKSDETSDNTKKQKISHETQPKKKLKNNRKLKRNPNMKGIFKKITDFFNSDTIKIEDDSNEQISEINEIVSVENSQNVMSPIIVNNSSGIISSEKEDLPLISRTLRSKSKVPEDSNIKESVQDSNYSKKIVKDQTSSSSTLITNDVHCINDLIDKTSEVTSDVPVLKDTVSSVGTFRKHTDDQSSIIIDIPESKEISEVSEVFPDSKKVLEAKSLISKCGKRSKKGNAIKSPIESVEENNIPKNEEQIMKENSTLLNLDESATTSFKHENIDMTSPESSNELEIQDEKKDSNENHLIMESSIKPAKSTQKKRLTNQRKKPISPNVQNPIGKTSKIINNEEKEKNVSITQSGTEENKVKKGKRKTLNEIQKAQPEIEQKKEQKNEETKLEIYDFDDESDEGIEMLKKSVKNRKRQTKEKSQIEKKRLESSSEEKTKINDEKTVGNEHYLPNKPMDISEGQVEIENINNNGQNTSMDSNGDDKSGPEGVKVEEVNQNWKPVYGPYKRIDRCNVCLMAFKSYKKLRAHKKIHEVDNPYKCNQCEDSFEDVEKLAAHLRIHKGFDEDMDLIDLHSEIDVPDVKPVTPSMLNIINKSCKQQNLSVSSEVAEPNEELDKSLEEPNNIEETESSLEDTNKKDIQTKIKEVKRKLTNAIKMEAGGKRKRMKRKVTLSRVKTELEEEQGYDSDDNFLNSYIPVEDQDEYSQIEKEDSFIPVEDQDEYSQIEGENSCIPVEDQNEYSQTEREESDILPLSEEENEAETVNEGNSVVIDYENDIEDQEEYSQISYQGSEISELLMECTEDIDAENGQECSEIEDAEASTTPVDENIEYGYIHEDSEQSFREEEECDDEEMEVENCREDSEYEAPIEVMNEMAEAEYLLEKDTNVSPKTRGRKKRKNAKSTKDLGPRTPKIIKINRDNLPPLIVKSIRKKTLLLGKMPFACKKCDATFWTSFQLDKHQLVHVLKKAPAPVKPPSKVFKCEECGKEFKKICDLERHTRVHTGEKPSVCNICNKRFQQSYNLNKHLYTHTQEKNFECVICQKKFGRNDVLNRHVLTHSIVKPFRCSVCSRTFIRNTQLKLHLQKHHGLDEDPENESSNADNVVAGTSAD